METISVANTFIGEEEAEAVFAVVKSGWISMGAKVREFEQAVCAQTGARHAIAMNNGTSTLHALLVALGVGPGDEVIVPSLTYISSANVVLFQGAELVLCESDPETFNVEPEHVRAKMTPRTHAIMTVDLKGMPVDFGAFRALSEETGVPWISDSAESLGAVYKGRPVGTQALAHSFSFFANKNITTGEGGMVTTDDDDLAERLRIVRNQGQEGRYNHTVLGNNYRMTDIAAAFGCEQMKRLDWLMAEKNALAATYDAAFADMPEIGFQRRPDYVDRHSWYNYSITVAADLRDGLVAHLAKAGIDTRISFPPVHIQPYYRDRFGFRPEDYPLAYDAYRRFIDLPCWVGMTRDHVERVVGCVRQYLNAS